MASQQAALHHRIKQLIEENRTLKEENARLRKENADLSQPR